MSDFPFENLYLDPDWGSGSPTDLAARRQAAERMERLNVRLELETALAKAQADAEIKKATS